MADHVGDLGRVARGLLLDTGVKGCFVEPYVKEVSARNCEDLDVLAVSLLDIQSELSGSMSDLQCIEVGVLGGEPSVGRHVH